MATTKGRINWLLSKLRKTTDDTIATRAIWQGRAPDTMATLASIKERGVGALMCSNPSLKL